MKSILAPETLRDQFKTKQKVSSRPLFPVKSIPKTPEWKILSKEFKYNKYFKSFTECFKLALFALILIENCNIMIMLIIINFPISE